MFVCFMFVKFGKDDITFELFWIQCVCGEKITNTRYEAQITFLLYAIRTVRAIFNREYHLQRIGFHKLCETFSQIVFINERGTCTGCFFRKVPPTKVLSMELVPINRIKWLSTLVPPKATRGAKNNQNERIFTLH